MILRKQENRFKQLRPFVSCPSVRPSVL